MFKRFTVWHDRCAMKVGTDGVLLGALAKAPHPKIILDVGTGTGLVALMLAQRFPDAMIEAIDIDEGAVSQAMDNVERSPFCDRIDVRKEDFCKMEKHGTYDLIVSNPPFYEEDTSCPDSQRNTARHTTSLPFSTLIENASAMLSDDGVFAVIIPTERAANFIIECATNGLYLSLRTNIKTTMKKQEKRCVLHFTKEKRTAEVNTLILNDAEGKRTKEYEELTNEFYLSPHPA